jgi:hypothetical protein
MQRLCHALHRSTRAAPHAGALRRAFAAGGGGEVPVVPLLIGGERVVSAATEFFDVHNPATGALLCRVPQTTPAELQRAFDSAAAAQRSWRDVPVTVRPGRRGALACCDPSLSLLWPKRRAASCGHACAARLTRRNSLHLNRLARA